MWKELTNKSTVPPGTVVKRKETGAGFRRGELYTVISCLSRNDPEDKITFRFENKEGFPENFLIEVPDEILNSYSPLLKGSVVICNTNYYDTVFYGLEYIVEEDSNNTCSAIRIGGINYDKKFFHFIRGPITVGSRVRLLKHSIYSHQNDGFGTVTDIDHSLSLPIIVTWDKNQQGGIKNSYGSEHLELAPLDIEFVSSDVVTTPLQGTTATYSRDPVTSGVSAFNKGISEKESHDLLLRYSDDAIIPVGTMIKRIVPTEYYLTVGKTYCVLDSMKGTVYVIDDNGNKNGFDPDKFVPVNQEAISPSNKTTMAIQKSETLLTVSKEKYLKENTSDILLESEAIEDMIENMQQGIASLEEMKDTFSDAYNQLTHAVDNKDVRSIKKARADLKKLREEKTNELRIHVPAYITDKHISIV